MFMVVVALETDNPLTTDVTETTFGVCQPHSATCAQHYYGQTLGWPGTAGDGYSYTIKAGTPGEDHMIVSGNTPLVYVAGGSHATFPNNRAAGYEVHSGNSFDEASQYDMTPNLIWDVTTPLKGTGEVGYPLIPLTSSVANWKGHWGDEDWDGGFEDFNTGPVSPSGLGSGSHSVLGAAANVVNRMSDPRAWHNHYVKSNQDGGAGEPDVRVP